MDSKKISFGFSKTAKKSNIKGTDTQKNIELIDCIESQTIKIVGKAVNTDYVAPLVIPLKQGNKISVHKRQPGKEVENPNDYILTNTTNPEQIIETIEQKAAKEILEELSANLNQEVNELSNLELPLHANELPLDGAKESTMNDYVNIPIAEFGMAMLRGMGFKDDQKKKSSIDIDAGPVLRPKGMGLGADKVVKTSSSSNFVPEEGEILRKIKDSFVKITDGKYRNCYGQIEGHDEGSGRIIVKLTLGGRSESINELMVQPVSRKEYKQYSKLLNKEKFDKVVSKTNEEQVKNNYTKSEKDRKYNDRKDEYHHADQHCTSIQSIPNKKPTHRYDSEKHRHKAEDRERSKRKQNNTDREEKYENKHRREKSNEGNNSKCKIHRNSYSDSEEDDRKHKSRHRDRDDHYNKRTQSRGDNREYKDGSEHHHHRSKSQKCTNRERNDERYGGREEKYIKKNRE